MSKISLVLVGLGGYGGYYMTFIKESVDPKLYELTGVVDPYAKMAPAYERVKSQNIPVFDTLEEFYQDHSADLVLICTPIPLHKSQTICALEHGSHVLCEKPIAPLLQDAVMLQQKADECKKLLGVGFQWSYAKPVLDFKADILSGLFGTPKTVKTYVSWKRYDAYYENSSWKGRVRNQGGDWILDHQRHIRSGGYCKDSGRLPVQGRRTGRYICKWPRRAGSAVLRNHAPAERGEDSLGRGTGDAFSRQLYGVPWNKVYGLIMTLQKERLPQCIPQRILT